ncbi:MAG: hypothetical protein ACJ8F7_01820 [Gemmataceae bacterium]
MRRRAFLRTLASLGLGLTALLGGLAGLVLHEPASYRGIPVPEGKERRQLSGQFWSSCQEVRDSIDSKDDTHWQESFTADQMNSYFEEDFLRAKPFHLPPGLHTPRVAIEPNHLQLAFRYGHGFWSTVVRLDLNLWLVVREPNVVAIELLGVHAGALPISIQSMLEELADSAQQANIEVTWYRHEGHPVALLHFQADREHPRYLLQRLELQDGRLVLAGKSSGDAVPFRQMVSMLEQGH